MRNGIAAKVAFLLFIGLLTASVELWSMKRVLNQTKYRHSSDTGDGSIVNGINVSDGSKQLPNRSLTCSEVQRLEIVRTIHAGAEKMTFEVKLPWGGRAVAKRCKRGRCVELGLIVREAEILKGLQEQYGRSTTLGYYGHCDMQGAEKAETSNFTYGTTSVIEMGSPFAWEDFVDGKRFMADCLAERRKCVASHLTAADIEDLKGIARQYANYSKGALLLQHPWEYRKRKYKKYDNCYIHQYVVTTSGLRHVDMDHADVYDDVSYEEAVEINCEIVRMVAAKNITCSEFDSDTEYPDDHIEYPDDHIDPDQSVENCKHVGS